MALTLSFTKQYVSSVVNLFICVQENSIKVMNRHKRYPHFLAIISVKMHSFELEHENSAQQNSASLCCYLSGSSVIFIYS